MRENVGSWTTVTGPGATTAGAAAHAAFNVSVPPTGRWTGNGPALGLPWGHQLLACFPPSVILPREARAPGAED